MLERSVMEVITIKKKALVLDADEIEKSKICYRTLIENLSDIISADSIRFAKYMIVKLEELEM